MASGRERAARKSTTTDKLRLITQPVKPPPPSALPALAVLVGLSTAGSAVLLLSTGGGDPPPRANGGVAKAGDLAPQAGAVSEHDALGEELDPSVAPTLTLGSQEQDALAANLARLSDVGLNDGERREALLALERLDQAQAAREAWRLLQLGGEGGTLEGEALRIFASDPAAAGLSREEAARFVLGVLARAGDAELALAAGVGLDLLYDALDPAQLRSSVTTYALPEARIVVLRAISLLDSAPAPTQLSFFEQVLQRDPSPQVRGEALALLLRLGGPEAAELVARTLERDGAVRQLAGGSLGRVRDSSARVALERAFSRANDPQEARALARALASSPEDVPTPLAEAARGAGPRASAAVEALGAALNPAREQFLRDLLLRGSSEEVRVQALLALARNARLGREELQSLASSDPSALVRRTAAEALQHEEG